MRILIRPQRPTPNTAAVITTATIRVAARPQRVLDFDIENRPLSYLGSDFTTAEVTAVSWAWADDPNAVTVRLLGETPLADILDEFLDAYKSADLVTGHYIRGHDLPMVNGALMELKRPPLPDKLTQDTKLDLMRTKGLSLSQESLGAMFRLESQKVTMNQIKWRSANRLEPEGLALVRERVVGDVRQHLELRAALLEHEYLAPPRLWRSGSAPTERYTP